jgi:hypothetical protein
MKGGRCAVECTQDGRTAIALKDRSCGAGTLSDLNSFPPTRKLELQQGNTASRLASARSSDLRCVLANII